MDAWMNGLEKTEDAIPAALAKRRKWLRKDQVMQKFIEDNKYFNELVENVKL